MKNESMKNLEERFAHFKGQPNQMEHMVPMVIGSFRQGLETALARTNMERTPILESVISSEAQEQKAVDELRAAIANVFVTIRDAAKNDKGAQPKKVVAVADLEPILLRLEQQISALFTQFTTAHAATGKHVQDYTKLREHRLDALTDLVADLHESERGLIEMVVPKNSNQE